MPQRGGPARSRPHSGRAQPTTPFGQAWLSPFGSALMENFETVADRLYALAPARFTAARNAAA
ncbi:hypothetical protein ACFC1R_30435, partial [Kitasatospora sp. NPDC056138]|uniref:hypothetical protein n=1 Tax=Kitasatospora sp. NPDC056138 TaxID=3345724 RepID=UPI0035E2CB56